MRTLRSEFVNVPERRERAAFHFIHEHPRPLDVDDLEDKPKFRSKQPYLERRDVAGSDDFAAGYRNKIELRRTNEVEAAFGRSINKRFND
jgi:hypothetical protein